MPSLTHPLTAWAVSLGMGLLIGAERERRKGEGPHRAPAGIRTFAVTSLLGTAAMSLGGAPLLAVVTAGLLGLLLIAYARDTSQDPGLTTEIALVVTLFLGALAVSRPATTAGLGVAVAGLLASRAPMHRFVREVLTEAELKAALVFFAATLVVWPVIPNRYLGPFGALNPRTMWTVVILTMGISAGGYIARRALGASRGLPITGLASGFISASATVAAMGARAKEEPLLLAPAVAAAALSTVATVAQMTLLLAATSQVTLAALAPSLALAGAAALACALLFSGRLRSRQPAPAVASGSAFSLRIALTLAGTLGLVLIAVAGLRAWLGDAGLIAATGLAGFADAHAAAVSVAAQVAHGGLTAADARVPILLGLTTNSVTKIVLALGSGSRPFAWRVIPGLIAVLLAAWAGLLVGTH